MATLVGHGPSGKKPLPRKWRLWARLLNTRVMAAGLSVVAAILGLAKAILEHCDRR